MQYMEKGFFFGSLYKYRDTNELDSINWGVLYDTYSIIIYILFVFYLKWFICRGIIRQMECTKIKFIFWLMDARGMLLRMPLENLPFYLSYIFEFTE